MITNAAAVMVAVAIRINHDLRAQTKDVDQKDTRLDTRSFRLEASGDEPANALSEQVCWPKRFVRRLASSAAEVVGHGWRKYIVWRQRINSTARKLSRCSRWLS